ncbi:hypothetical protein ACHAXA_008735 [Cyclostephanos tholiformis]|uniref:Uncharacterized protein n=1 Tax=Cyclostephanos tholiformis TaxID=382380 RepID=A0ABD3RB71_9STRA
MMSKSRDGRDRAHRSKSRTRVAVEDYQRVEQTPQQREESLRDYWRRRAEESKERVGGTAASGGGGGTGGVSSIGEEVSTLAIVGTRSTTGKELPPPPPRAGIAVVGRTSSRSRDGAEVTSSSSGHYRHHHRSKSRSRDDVDRVSSSFVALTTSESSARRQPQPPTPQQRQWESMAAMTTTSSSHRKIDSIASALGAGRASSLSSTTVTSSSSPPSRSTPTKTASSSILTTSAASTPQTRRSLLNFPSVVAAVDGRRSENEAVDSSPLHRCLAQSSWRELRALLRSSSSTVNDNDDGDGIKSEDMVAALSAADPRHGGTAIHVAAWKAPPALVATMLRMATARDGGTTAIRELLGLRDADGNTPLHLCAGNLDHRPGEGREGEEKEGELNRLCLVALEEMAKLAPIGAWTVKNSEGDSPIHMLMSSPLCTCDLRSSSSSSRSGDGEVRARLAMEAMSLALSSPDAVQVCAAQDGSGATPLHIALASGARDCVVEALLSSYPEAARVEDERGMLPIHWAAAFCKTGHAAVRKLVDAYPEGLTRATADGDIPLHLAVSNAAMEDESGDGRAGRIPTFIGDCASSRREMNRLKIVELLMYDTHRYAAGSCGNSTSRDSSSTTSSEGAVSPILTTNREKLTPLHCCALFDAPPQISKLLMKHPDANAASSMTNSFGATPLHLAAAPGVSQSIATVLAIGSPDAAAVQDRLKRTPLHVAAQNAYATNLLIKTLAELNPNAASVKTQRGHLPLHLAAQSQAKEAVVRALIKAYPAAAESRNKSNNTPLHDAAKYRASLGVVRLLLDAYPKALYVQNQYGNLPLHCATAYQAPSDVVQLLLKRYPEAASMQNRNQDAPLHYAAAYATSIAAVRPLIEAAPAAVLLLNSSGQSPVDRAKANNAHSDIVRLLENAAEEYSRNATNGDGSWASFGQGDEKAEV